MTTPSNVLPSHLKQTFPPIIWIFTEGEGDGIESGLPFEIFSLPNSYQITGIDLPFLSMYGVGDQPPSEENEHMKILMMKDAEIDWLKHQIQEYKLKRARIENVE